MTVWNMQPKPEKLISARFLKSCQLMHRVRDASVILVAFQFRLGTELYAFSFRFFRFLSLPFASFRSSLQKKHGPPKKAKKKEKKKKARALRLMTMTRPLPFPHQLHTKTLM